MNGVDGGRIPVPTEAWDDAGMRAAMTDRRPTTEGMPLDGKRPFLDGSGARLDEGRP